MKKLITLLFLSTAFISPAQVGIGVAPASINGSAQLEVASTTKGFLPPRMTYDQKTAISSPVQGLMIYCTNCGADGELEYYNGTAWVNMAGGAAATVPVPVAYGDVYGGGIVFYILRQGDLGYNPNVQHGLIASFTDQSNGISWSNGNDIRIGGTGGSIGTGLANTNAIIAAQGNGSYAAKLARDYRGGGFSDWYLGSEREMLKFSGSVDGQWYGGGRCLLCFYLSPVTPFTVGANEYWTSSEVDSAQAFRQNVGSPSQYAENKSNTKAVRAIRSF